MSSTSQFKIFAKSNLVYVSLSITIARTLNFIVNSPLSIWQKFPPELLNSKRFYVLLSLALLFVSIPLIYCGNKLPLHNKSVIIASNYGIKSVDSHIIPPNLENSNEKEKSLSIKSPTASQINKKLFKCFIIIIAKWLILEFTSSTYIISTKWAIEIPEKVYQVRLLKFFTKRIIPITIPSILRIFLQTCIYDFNKILCLCFHYCNHLSFIFHSTSEKNQYKPILIQHGLLTLTEYVSLKEWMMTFIFNTKSLFNQPWMASSPRDFWNLLTTFVPRKIANMMGVLGAFAISSLLHEYIIIGNYNIWAGEQTFFFMIHGVIFILWEAIFVFPAFIEPSLRNYKLSSIPTFTTVYVQRFINNL
ncbi:hypothetical protein GLOIN_2v1775005 [Rhizophagus irregularis DAOM 181602=DAOM 197198]|nr:hypothetical protein GLOIN_2v1775005 [Rhizophagus irregularis DAOM 181602=DAOM 197198]